MDVKSSCPGTGGGREGKQRAYLVVHTGEIRSVCDVESFRRKSQTGFFAQFVGPAQTHVKAYVVRTEPGVAWGSDRALVGRVIVAVHLAPSQQVERVSTVVGENGSQLEPGQDMLAPGAVDDSPDHHLVPFIKLGESPIQIDVRWILRAVVAVVVGGRVKPLAEGVVAKHTEALAEAPFEFNDAAFVIPIGLRAVLVVLHDQRIHKALYGCARQASGTAERVCRRAGIPVAVGNPMTIGQGHGRERRQQRIRVDCDRKPLGMGVDAADRYGGSRHDLALNSKGNLLGDRGAIPALVHENNLQWANGTAIRNVDTKRGHGRRGDAGSIPWSGSCALNQALCEES